MAVQDASERMPRERSLDINDESEVLLAESLPSSTLVTNLPVRPTIGGDKEG
jgi:hypothetical protein